MVEGISSTGMINVIKNSRHNWLGILFPFYPYTIWFMKNLGVEKFSKKY